MNPNFQILRSAAAQSHTKILQVRQGHFNLYSIMWLVSERSSQRTKDCKQGFLQKDGRPGHVHPIL